MTSSASVLVWSLLLLTIGACEEAPVGTTFGQECDEDVAPRATCESFCETAATECGIFATPADVCGEICECQLQEGLDFDEACGTAWEAEYACAGTLDCTAFIDYFGRIGNAYPCRDEVVATDSACILN